ncbi:MAG: type IX secretion system outer membrane channel protein PorV [Bacteroidetes bacterium]|nr:type IX secretion system outer membrane channel protein PorV [Bacteroidota bacterium]
MWFPSRRRFAPVVSLFLIAAVSASAQVSGGSGGSAVPFLIIPPNARTGGMGEVGTGTARDISATFYNVGGLAYQKNTQVSVTYSKWLPQFNADLHYSYVNGSTFVKDLDGTVNVHFVFLDLGEFQQTFETGQQGAKFRSLEFAIGAGYSTMVADDVGFGVQARYIQSNLSSVTVGNEKPGIGRSVAFDIGALWTPKTDWGMPEDFISLGANFANIGPKIHYVDIQQADPLPTTFRIGAGLHLVKDEFNDLTAAIDMDKLLVNRPSINEVDPVPKSIITSWGNGKGVEWSMGLEYWYEQLVALRAGYFTETAAGGNRRFFTFGAGLRYDMYGFDFSYINTIDATHPLANTLRFTFVVDFDHDSK